MQISIPPAAPHSLNKETLKKEALTQKALTQETLNRETPDLKPLLRRAAFDLLARREHSRQELVSKISRRFAKRKEWVITPAMIESVLDPIAAQGLQSDQRYLESFIRLRIQQSYGPLRIAQELKQKKISAEQFEPLLDSHGAEWLERAKAAKERKFSSGKAMDQKSLDHKERARQMRFLQYRGFSGEQICFAMTQ